MSWISSTLAPPCPNPVEVLTKWAPANTDNKLASIIWSLLRYPVSKIT